MLTIRTRMHIIAAAVGLWPFAFIMLGVLAYDLTHMEREAIIAHERGHLRLWHAWRSLWWRIRGLDVADQCERRRALEYEADAFAVKHGHASGLLVFLHRLPPASTLWHPSPRERIARIRDLDRRIQAP